MRRFKILCAGVMGMALVSLTGGAPAQAATFVYVSNAEDGDISTFTLKPDGELQVNVGQGEGGAGGSEESTTGAGGKASSSGATSAASTTSTCPWR